MQLFNEGLNTKIWTVTEAKARLSELLRLSADKPQYIGTKKTYVLVPRETWEKATQAEVSMGQYLVETMAGLGELELPSREDAEREIPFQ